MAAVQIHALQPGDQAEWLRLALWPDHSAAELQQEMNALAADPSQPVFAAVCSDGRLCGLVEMARRGNS